MFQKIILDNKSSFLNLVANVTKIAGKSIWQFALPALLATVTFAQYGQIQYFSATLVPLATLGNQHVIMRSGNTTIPFMGMLLHSCILVLIEVIIVSILFEFEFNTCVIVILFSISTIFYNTFTSKIKSFKLFKYSLIIEFIGAFFYLVGLISILKFPNYITQVAVVEIVILLLTVFFSFIILLKVGDNSLFVFKGLNQYYKSIYNIGVNVVLDTLIWRLIPVYFIHLLPNFKEQESVFYFSLLLGNAFVLIPSSIVESWIPEIASHYINENSSFYAFFRKKFWIFKISIAITLSISIIILFIVLNTIYVKFYAWRIVIGIFVIFRIISSYFDLHSATLYASKNEKKLILPAITGALVLCMLSLVLYFYFKFIGILSAFIISRLLVSYLTYSKFKGIISDNI